MTSICPYFGVCGGCSYQNLNEADYIATKERFIQNALRHEEIDFPLLPLVRIKTASRRRATLAYCGGVLGFNAKKSHSIIDISSCLVLAPELEAFILKLKKFVRSWKGAGDVSILMTQWGADVSVLPKKMKDKKFPKKKRKKETEDVLFLEDINLFCRENNVARFIWDETPVYQALSLPFPPNVFMQPSVDGEKTLIDLVLKASEESKKIIDLFCGLGTFTKPLAQAGKKVKGFDITEQSILSLQQQNIPAQVRDLFRAPLMSDEFEDYDTVVLDPARAGAKEQCIQVALSSVKKAIMISCNPITFARDCRILIENGFSFNWIQPVDQFTYTEHVETVVLMSRVNTPKK